MTRRTVITAGVAAGAYMVLTPLLVLGVVLASTVTGVLAGSCQRAGGAGGGAAQVGTQTWSAAQMTNAHTIVRTTAARGLPRRAAVIALAVAMVESRLRNVDHGDRDSLGLFQQRPSMGWGSPAQVLNPVYATNAFLDRLVQVPRWRTRPLGVVAQAVQRSAFPQRYARWESEAQQMAGRFWRGPADPVPPASQAQLAALVTTGCPDQGGATLPLDPEKLPPGYQLPADPRQRAAVAYALAQLDKPYVWGAKGPNAFDCSGLMQAAWAHAGVAIPAGTYGQVDAGQPVAGISAVQPGDLLFIPGSMGTAANPRHVGMYAGHGLVVNAYDANTDIVLASMSDWAGEIVAIRRPAPPAIPAPPYRPPQPGGDQA